MAHNIDIETLKEFFAAGYDYRSSLTPEIIEDYGVDSCRNFEQCLDDYKKELQPIEAIEDGWISVEDRLLEPEEGKKYLVWVTDLQNEGEIDTFYFRNISAGRWHSVTHWKLPLPPKK